MNAAQISSATTAELVAFFNANAAKPVARFSDRKTAERRVSALIAEIEAKMALVRAAAPAPAPAAAKAEGCPACGTVHDQTCGRVVDTPSGQRVLDGHVAVCHHCGHTYSARTRKPAKFSDERSTASLSAAIAKSWADPAVKAARSARHAVVVAGSRYSSVRAAFAALGLELRAHTRVRSELVANGAAEFGGHKFALAPAA